MSRVLKFRIWDKANKEYMILGATGLDARNGDVIDYYNEGNRLGGPEEYDVEQYTGSTDKNGKEIYEGDIVEEDIDFNSKMTDGTFRYKVYWNEDELCWSLDPISLESIHNDLWELNSSCRVIGNVHEPPKDFRPEHLKRMVVSISKGSEE